MKKFIYFVLLVFLSAFIYFAIPVYQFDAHKGELPMMPWGWLALPNEMPIENIVYDEKYSHAAAVSLQALVAKREQIQSPAISTAVMVNSELVWAAAVGWDDIKSLEQASTHTRFRIGSSSKALTALLLARLVQAQHVDLDVPITQYLSNTKNPAWQQITLRQLASHMSGIPHYKENTEITGLYRSVALNKNFSSMLDAIQLFDESELLFKPGTDFHYSSLGTVLLAAVLESVMQKDYYSLFQNHISKPLGVDGVVISPVNSENTENMATFYKAREGNKEFKPWRDVNLTHRLPGGGLAASPSDLVKLATGLLDSSFVKSGIREQFLTPQKLSNGQINEQNYALGWRITQWDKNPPLVINNANHGGVSRGSQCWLMLIPEHNMAIAVTINRKTEHFWDFAEVAMTIAEQFIQ